MNLLNYIFTKKILETLICVLCIISLVQIQVQKSNVTQFSMINKFLVKNLNIFFVFHERLIY